MTKKDVTNDQIMTALTQFAGSVDERFDKVDQRFDKLGVDVADVKGDVSRIYDILDVHMARIERILEENSVQNHQQERIQRWVFQIADKAGVQLKYE